MIPDPIQINIGPVEAIIEPQSGQLRYVKVGDTELIRGIYAAVREENWGTVVPTISDLKVTHVGKRFSCEFKANHEKEPIKFSWTGRISAEDKGDGQFVLEYEFLGQALTDFKTCRTGICVLHPRSHQGLKVEVEHNNGPCEQGAFPIPIRPDQPFKDVKAITLEPSKGIDFKVEFFGEVFEMEDQRNWADPSYKTYCRPQEWGSPYPLKSGQKVEHRIKMTISTASEVRSPLVKKHVGIIPNLGTLINRAHSKEELAEIKNLGLGHVQTNMDGFKSAKDLSVPVILQTETPSLPSELSPQDGLALNPPQSWQKLNNFRGAKRYAASLGNFVDLNRCRPTFDEIEGVAYAMNPQVHAFDTLTLFECTWTLSDQVSSSRTFGAKEVVVGPITLKQGGSDPRIKGIEAALFTFSAICHLAIGKANLATFFDAATLLASPARLPIQLLAEETLSEVTVYELEPGFVMLQGRRTILANLTWLPSEAFKQTPLDLPENIKVGIKGSYRLFTEENISDWKEVLAGPPSHSILTALPPFSLVVIG